MTPEKQRIVIAEHLGFKPGTFITETHWFDDCVSDGQEEVLFADHATGGAQVRVPEFLKDLNAMHAAILSLPADLRGVTLTSTLARVCGFNAHGTSAWSELHEGRCAVINATAAQRAEAFLKTVGKWEDGDAALNDKEAAIAEERGGE
jgi:hypothetical protein